MRKFMQLYTIYVLVLLSVLYLLPPDIGTKFEHFKKWFLLVLQKPETLQNTVYFTVLVVAISIVTNIFLKIKEHQKNEK